MEMQMSHITTEDCRGALSHCQQKMDRAAAWLLEQSDDIERKKEAMSIIRVVVNIVFICSVGHWIN